MPRRYTTMGEVVDQLKVNNETNVDIKSGIHALEGDFGKFFAYLNRDRRERLEQERELGKQKAAAQSKTTGASKRAKGTGLLSGIGDMFKGMGAGVAGVGVGLGGFFMGLAGAEAIMTKFGSGDNLKNMMINLAEGLAAFQTRDLVALGALLAGGALFGAVGVIPGMKGIGAGIGMTAIGFGIAGFFSGLAAGDMAIEAMESTGANLSTFMKNIAEGLGALNNDQMIKIGGLLAVGGGLGALFTSSYKGLSRTGGAVVGMGAIGLGIGAFFSGLGVGDKLTQMMNVDGSNLKNMMKNVAEGLGAFDPTILKGLAVAMAGGALIGLLGPVAGLKVASGMALIGAGISGFLGAIAGIGDLFNKIGVTGEGFKNIMKNVAGGLSELNNIEAEGLLKKIGAMAGVGPALLAFVGGTAVVQGLDAIIDGAKKILNFMFGTEFKDQKTARSNLIKDTVESLKPLSDIDVNLGTKLKTLSSTLLDFVGAFNKAGSDLNPEKFGEKMEALGIALSSSRELLMVMANGGSFAKDGPMQWLLRKSGLGGKIQFGKEGSGGILDPNLKMDKLVEQIRKVDQVLGRRNAAPVANPQLSGTSSGGTGAANGNTDASVNIATTNNNIDNSSKSSFLGTSDVIDLDDQLRGYHAMGASLARGFN